MSSRSFLCGTGNGTFVMVGDPSNGFPYHFERMQKHQDVQYLLEMMKSRKDVGIMQNNFTEDNYFFQACQGKEVTGMTLRELT